MVRDEIAMFSVWDLVVDKENVHDTGHVVATSADSEDFASTLGEEHPYIVYHHSVAHHQHQFQTSDYQPPLGTVLVQFRKDLFPVLYPVDRLVLRHRQLLAGDIVVNASSDHQRGTVLKSETKCTVQTVSLLRSGPQGPHIPAHFLAFGSIDGNGPRPAKDWRDWSTQGVQFNQVAVEHLEEVSPPTVFRDVDLFDLKTPAEHQKGDPVLYGDWAGIIQSIHEEITLRLLNNTVVVLEHGVRPSQPLSQPAYSSYNHGDTVAVKKGDLRKGRWLFGAYDPNVEPIGVIVKIRVFEMTIDWQSNKTTDARIIPAGDWPPQVIGLDEIESGEYLFYDMQHFTAHPSTTAHVDELTTDPDLGALCGPRVVFADTEAARSKYGSRPDGLRLFEHSRASNLGFDMNIYDVVDRSSTVKVQWQDGTVSTEETANVVYADFTEEDLYPGDIVCTRETRTSMDGCKIPEKVGVVQAVVAVECVAKVRWFCHPHLHLDGKEEFAALPNYLLGELAEDIFEVSMYDLVVPWGLDIGYLDNVGYFTGSRLDPAGTAVPNSWVGHVLEVHLDASYTIRLGAVDHPYNLRATIDQLILILDPEVAFEKEDLEQQAAYDEDHDMHSEGLEESGDEDEDIGAIMMGNRQELIEYVMDDQVTNTGSDNDSAWSTDDEEAVGVTNNSAMDLDSAVATSDDSLPAGQIITPPAYVLLDGEVPAGHRYFEEKGTIPPQTLRKVMKEHKMLSGDKSMPPGVFVRSWESHCNLLRALIIGPVGTPYANCPFVFDIMLPADFPRTPPKVHFYHWTTGSFARNTKINPNLYQDGNVCLSLLNTWPGQETEGWIAGQSTLLQALISIQSLILVPEPFYNEPGYEGKRNAPGTNVQSVAYNERVLLQSRGFLQHAIASVRSATKDLSLEGVEDVIQMIYLRRDGSQILKQVVEDGEELIRKSKASDSNALTKRDGISIISKGALHVLEKTQESLRQHLEGEQRRQ